MIIVTNQISEKYSSWEYTPDCIKEICDENCCLKDTLNHNLLILDGDEIERCNGRNHRRTLNKSCDCIILKNPYHEKVLLVELKSGQVATELKEAKEKFRTSAKEIMDALSECQIEHISLSLLLLGNLDDSAKKSPKLEFEIRDKYCYIQNLDCDSSIEEVNDFL